MGKKSERLQIVLSVRETERLDALVERTEPSTRTEVVRKGLFLLRTLVAEHDAGSTIVIRDASGNETQLRIDMLLDIYE